MFLLLLRTFLGEQMVKPLPDKQVIAECYFDYIDSHPEDDITMEEFENMLTGGEWINELEFLEDE